MVINYEKLFSTRYVCTQCNLSRPNWVRIFFLTFGRLRLRCVHTHRQLNTLQINYIKMLHKHLTEYLTTGTIMANGGIVQIPPGSF